MPADKPPFTIVELDGTEHTGTREEAEKKSIDYHKARHLENERHDEHHLMIFQGFIKAGTPILAGLGNGILSLDQRDREERAAARAHELELVKASPEYATLKLNQEHELSKQVVDRGFKLLDEMTTTLLAIAQAAARK